MKKVLALILNLICFNVLLAQSNLTITFENVDDLSPKAVLTFPDKSSKIITESTTIEISQKGNYQIECSMLHKKNAIADELFTCASQKINVQALDKNYSFNLNYQKVNGTGGLIIPTSNQEISIFNWENLLAQENEPTIKISSEKETMLVAADTSGNIWFWDREALNKINAQDIESGDAKVSKRFNVPNAYNALFNCNAMRIDSKNRMWMSLMHENLLIVIDLDKISDGADAKPIHVLTTRFATTDFAISHDEKQIAVAGIGGFVIFEMPQNWSANFIELKSICKSHEAGTFTALDYDSQGNLWLASENGGIFKFAKSSLQNEQLTLNEMELEVNTKEYNYWGIKLDNSDNLWVMSRFEDGEYGIDYFENNDLHSSSKPSMRYLFPRNTEHGKFAFNGSNLF